MTIVTLNRVFKKGPSLFVESWSYNTKLIMSLVL